jgi:hypothetical protein
MGGMMPGGPMGDPMTGGGPMPYPPPGLYGADQWQPPFTALDNLGVHKRLAAKCWVTGEYLLWFSQSQPTVFPFVVTSAPADGGILGSPTTTILHSTSDLGYDLASGFRVTGGWFRDDARRYGLYLSGFLMENKADTYFARSDATGQPVLARPFIDVRTGLPSALFVSFPTFTSGQVNVYSSSRAWGAEGGPIVNLFRTCPDDCGPDGGCIWDVNFLAAFRYFQLREDLRIESQSTILPGATAPFDGKLYGPGSVIGVIDDFQATNRFYGGQVGLQTAVAGDRWSLGVTGKVAIGVMNQQLTVQGFSTINSPNPPTFSRAVGGLYANARNVGRYNNDEFAVIPEVGVNLSRHWTSWLSTHVGYNFLYASRVVRPGNQYSPVVDPAIIPTSPGFGLGNPVVTPNPVLTQSDYWLQGVTFGFTLRY